MVELLVALVVELLVALVVEILAALVVEILVVLGVGLLALLCVLLVLLLTALGGIFVLLTYIKIYKILGLLHADAHTTERASATVLPTTAN